MNFVKTIALILSIMFFTESSTHAMFGKSTRTKEDFVDQSTVEYFEKQFDRVSEEIAKHFDLLSASIGKDIVVAIGNTGSGKSTTLDWLAGKSLKSDDLGSSVELENPEDLSVLHIGTGDKATTKYPQPITINSIEFFDLPGFHDTEGTFDELLNVAFIKQILEKANSVKFMFVVGSDSVTSDRGESIKKLLIALESMLRQAYEDVIQNSSIFILTKSDYSGEKVTKFLGKYTSKDNCPILYEWIKNGKVFPFRKPIKKSEEVYEVSEEGQVDIFTTLRRCRGKKLSDLNFSSIYSEEAKDALSAFFKHLFCKKFDEMVPDIEKLNSISDCREAVNRVKGASKGDRNFESFWKRFNSDIDCVSAIKLLKPLTEDVFNKVKVDFRTAYDQRLQLFVDNCETNIQLLQSKFISKLENRMQCIVTAHIENILKDNKICACKDVDMAKSKIRDLETLLDAEQIKKNIVLEIESDEEINELVYESEAFKLFQNVLTSFCRQNLDRYVSRICDVISSYIAYYTRTVERLQVQVDGKEQDESIAIYEKIIEDLKCELVHQKLVYEQTLRANALEHERRIAEIKMQYELEIQRIRCEYEPQYENQEVMRKKSGGCIIN